MVVGLRRENPNGQKPKTHAMSLFWKAGKESVEASASRQQADAPTHGVRSVAGRNDRQTRLQAEFRVLTQADAR